MTIYSDLFNVNPLKLSEESLWNELKKNGSILESNMHPSPLNKSYFYCVGCRTQDKPFNIINAIGHKKCFEQFYDLPRHINRGWLKSIHGKNMSEKNNSISECPHCKKSGQYRAMKRWHFDKCKFMN